jgi:CubicO group peptidase (beta-lactamase class C family)
VGLAVVPVDAGPPGASPARDDGVAAVVARYQARIPRLMAERHVPGLALAVVDRDHVVWQAAFGFTDDDRRVPVTIDTMFGVQSTSKAFTATAVMQAVQAGRLDLDAPITTYLPDFTVHSAFEPNPERRITLRMLLSHTAGLTHEAPVGNNYGLDPGSFDAHVRSIEDTWLRFPVGTGYAYSNLGIDLAGRVLEQVRQQPFPAAVRDSLLAPLGMDHSTFDRGEVRAAADRAVGHSRDLVPPPVDVPMTAAGGLWASAGDLARFLRLQLGNGTVDGRAVLDAALMDEMRTVPAPDAQAPAGYALGVARTRWRAGRYLDLFSHGGGGYGFLSDLWWLPQLGLGIAVLSNSDDHDLQGALALGILRDLVTDPRSAYHDRLLAVPPQSDVVEPDSHFVAPSDLAGRIAAVALPASIGQRTRWAGYEGLYRTGQLGAMDPTSPASRFRVESGVAYFDAAEDGTRVSRRLTEFQPGRFLSEDGETLDLRAPAPRWRGIELHRVAGGPGAAQWALLVAVAAVAAAWLGSGLAGFARRRRRGADPVADVAATGPPGLAWRRFTGAVAAAGAVCALAAVAAVALVPGFVDVGFLGRLASPVGIRLALHLPLAVAVLAAGLGALVVAGSIRRWWPPGSRARNAALAVALPALAAQLASWHLVAWGY